MFRLYIILYTYSRKDWKHKRIDTNRQSSQHDTASIITPRHYNTQFNNHQAPKIRR